MCMKAYVYCVITFPVFIDTIKMKLNHNNNNKHKIQLKTRDGNKKANKIFMINSIKSDKNLNCPTLKN